ncbi:hypothetical protein G3M48_002121, partial [Beauveria asiatica]
MTATATRSASESSKKKNDGAGDADKDVECDTHLVTAGHAAANVRCAYARRCEQRLGQIRPRRLEEISQASSRVMRCPCRPVEEAFLVSIFAHYDDEARHDDDDARTASRAGGEDGSECFCHSEDPVLYNPALSVTVARADAVPAIRIAALGVRFRLFAREGHARKKHFSQPTMDYIKTIVDLTGGEQLCFNCRALLDDGPKHRIHGHLLCNECADIVSLLRVHNWRVCLVCALAGEADDIDCADIQNFLDRPNMFVKQYDWKHCPVCDSSDNLLSRPLQRLLGQVESRKAQAEGGVPNVPTSHHPGVGHGAVDISCAG